jgi:hypothetical protein
MSFIISAAGDEVDLVKPRPGHITALAVAWSLAQQNRFTGHCIRPYSEAEHCLLISDIAQRELGLDVHGQLAALMQSAHKLLSVDMQTPVKLLAGAAFQKWEQQKRHEVLRMFALSGPYIRHRDAIQRAKSIALATARRDLLPRTPTPWAALQGIEPLARLQLNSAERRAVGWEGWRDRFLDRLHELDIARNRALYGCERHAAQPAYLEELG